MGTFDLMYNIAPSPFTGIVYSTLQTKDLGGLQRSYAFYQAVDGVENGVIRAYTIDSVASFFVGKPAFFEVYYRVRGGMIVPEVERVVMSSFPALNFFDEKVSDVLVYVNGELRRGLTLVDYTDVMFVLSLLNMRRPLVVLDDAKDRLVVRWGDDKVEFRKVESIPFVCDVCGNVRKFTVREDLLMDVVLVCNEHRSARGNGVFIKGESFFGWRFFSSFSPLFLVADLYGVEVRERFTLGYLEFSFVELPVYDLRYDVYVEVGGPRQVVKLGEYMGECR